MRWFRAAAFLLLMSSSGSAVSADQYFFRFSHTPIGGINGGRGAAEDPGLPPGGAPNADPLVASGTPPTSVRVGQNVLYGFSAAGGTPPYSWSVAATLPPGLSFDTDGTLYGTASAAGSGNSYSGITVTVTDAVLQQHTIGPFTMDVIPILSISGIWPTSCQVGQACTATFTASGGIGPYSWTLSNAPAGMSVSGSGNAATVSWTPATQGTYGEIVLTVSDAGGDSHQVIGSVSAIGILTANEVNPISMTISGNAVNPSVCLNGGTNPTYVVHGGQIIETRYATPVQMNYFVFDFYAGMTEAYDIEYWNGSEWIALPITNFWQFPTVITDRVRVKVNSGWIQTMKGCAYFI